MLDLTGRPVNEGDFIVYATKTESPSLQFGYIEQIKTTETDRTEHRTNQSYVSFAYKVKVRHADVNGNKLFKIIWDYDPITTTGKYRETDISSTAWLTEYGTSDIGGTVDTSKIDRLMVTQPI